MYVYKDAILVSFDMHSSVLYITSAVASETGSLPTSAQFSMHHLINTTILKDVIGT